MRPTVAVCGGRSLATFGKDVMKALAHLIIIAPIAIVLGGCAWRHAPGFSMHDNSYFMEPPYIAQKGPDYFLRWRYGSMGFYFSPESRVRDGRLVFSLQTTSSSGSRAGRLGEAKIEGGSKVHALETGGAFWWEPDGRMIQLKIVKELSNQPAAVQRRLGPQLGRSAI